jgi:hypothetical protein
MSIYPREIVFLSTPIFSAIRFGSRSSISFSATSGSVLVAPNKVGTTKWPLWMDIWFPGKELQP